MLAARWRLGIGATSTRHEPSAPLAEEVTVVATSRRDRAMSVGAFSGREAPNTAVEMAVESCAAALPGALQPETEERGLLLTVDEDGSC